MGEKIEDLVGVLFLPLYFALSGLRTNLGLLNDGITWGYAIGVIAIAFAGKIIGGTMAARLNGLVWRESLTIGCLMSCKGLVELIVLNIGLQAKILSTRTFTIFVVMALVTTFATTPLVAWLYPPWYQRKLDLWKKGKIDWDGHRLPQDGTSESSEDEWTEHHEAVRKVLVYLRLDGLPSVFTLVSMFAAKREEPDHSGPLLKPEGGGVFKNEPALSSAATIHRPVRVHGLRLMELTERDSSVMRVSEIEEYANRDPVIKAFGTFGQSRALAVAGQIAVVPEHSFAGTLMSRARELRSDLVLIPWSETGTMSEYPGLFDTKPGDPLANRAFASLTSELFDKAQETCHVGVVLDKTVLCRPDPAHFESTSPTAERPTRQLSRTMTGISMIDQANSTVHFNQVHGDTGRYRLLVVYEGMGQDDLFAVRFGLQLAKNTMVDLKVLVVPAAHGDGDEFEISRRGGNKTKQNVGGEFEMLRSSVPDVTADRVSFVDLAAGISSLDAVTTAIAEPSAAETVVLLGRNASARTPMLAAASSSREESRALGSLATSLVNVISERTLSAGLLVMQAKRDVEDSAAVGVAGGKAMQQLTRKAS